MSNKTDILVQNSFWLLRNHWHTCYMILMLIVILNLDSWSLKSPFCLKSESYVTFKAQNYFDFRNVINFCQNTPTFQRKTIWKFARVWKKWYKLSKFVTLYKKSQFSIWKQNGSKLWKNGNKLVLTKKIINNLKFGSLVLITNSILKSIKSRIFQNEYHNEKMFALKLIK